MFVNVLFGLAVGGAIYFLCAWVYTRSMHHRMTTIERANAQIEEDKARGASGKSRERLAHWLRDQGYDGDWTPLLLGVLVLYLVAAVTLRIVGLTSWVGAVIALPATLFIAVAALSQVKRRRRQEFQRQLMQALGLVATQVEAGDSARRAIEKTVPLVNDPLKSELLSALESLVGNASLVDALKKIAVTYPSRAMRLFIAALEIDDQMGAKLAPALRQAQASLEKDFELSAETQAEISQVRGEFFLITGIIGFIIATLVGGAEGISKEVYYSTTGIIILSIMGLNYAFGIFRALRIFRNAKGTPE